MSSTSQDMEDHMDVSTPVPSHTSVAMPDIDALVMPSRDDVVKIALSLYKVQTNIYLLDFQHIEVRI